MAPKISTIAVGQASFVTVTGVVATLAPTTFMKLYGLTPIAHTAAARIIAPAFGARNFGFALSIILFHQRGDYRSMATSMLCLAIAGIMDTVVTFGQGQYGGAAFHAGGSALLFFSALNM